MDIVSLIRSYVEGLLEAENRFIEHLDSFPELEKTVVELSNRMAAGFLGAVLTTADDLICESGIRKKEYTVQRKRMRTLISSVGDVTFTHTLYKDKQGQTKCLLDDQIRLPDRERPTMQVLRTMFRASSIPWGPEILCTCREESIIARSACSAVYTARRTHISPSQRLRGKK